MCRDLFIEQTALSGTVLIRELSSILEAHISSDGDTNRGGQGACGSQEGGEEEEVRENGARKVVAFTGKMLKSSRKYGGTSFLYHGKM